MIEASVQKETAAQSPAFYPIIFVTLSFAIGIVLDRWCDAPLTVLLAIFLVSFSSWVLFLRFLSQKRQMAGVALYCIILASGATWHHARWNWFPNDDIGSFSNEEFRSVVIRGEAVSEPVRVAAPAWNASLDTMKPKERVRFRLKVQAIRDAGHWLKASGVASVHVYLSEEQSVQSDPPSICRYGETVEIVGKLIGSRPGRNPGEFDFRSHFRAKGIFATLVAESDQAIKKLPPTGAEISDWSRANVRQHIDCILHSQLSRAEAAFASAVLLGNRDQMEVEIRDRFLKTGASHLLAISGLHVGILAGGFWLLLRSGFISRKNCLLLTIAFVIGYAWLVEFRPTVLRATILICVMCGARLLGKSTLSWVSLTTALFFVLLVNPSDIFSLGAQLSFLAISSIIVGKSWIYPPASNDPVALLIARTRSPWVRRIENAKRQIRAAFCVSLLIWSLALPLVAYHFHSIALIAPILNPLLLLPMSLALYSGVATILSGFVSPEAAIIPATACGTSLSTIQQLIDWSASFPAGHFWSRGPSLMSVILFYAGLLLFAAIPQTKLPAKWCILLGAAWLVFGWLLPDRYQQFARQNESRLELILIDVGHGSASLLKLPDGRNLLCDCGSLAGSEKAARKISDVLWHQKVDRLDAVIISHADVDHFNAFTGLADRFRIDSIWTSQLMQGDDAESVQTLFKTAMLNSVQVNEVHFGSKIRLQVDSGNETSGLEIMFLGPPNSFLDNKLKLGDNECSLILQVSWQGKTFLLPGDVEKLGLESMLAMPSPDVDVLVAAHHGSKNSDPTRFARWCRPQYVAVSCGSGRFGDKEKSLFKEGHHSKVLSTNENGALRFIVTPKDRVRAYHWNGERWKEACRDL